MKILIFAGGHGTRFWPLSRKNSPKQFDRMFNGKSTLELAIERVAPVFGLENIYISTGEQYKDMVLEQVKGLPEENLILEPERRDLAAAVGLAFEHFAKMNYHGPIAILWSDHLMNNVDDFRKALKTGEELINQDPNRFVYMGEFPRFANHNLGWITVGEKLEERNGLEVVEFKSWKYRPELELCKQLYASGKSFWNPGYFITSVDFVLDLYKEFAPEIYSVLEEIRSNPEQIKELYSKIEKISFDDAILEKTKPEQAVVIKVNLEWSDPGTLYALKEALQTSPEASVTDGKIFDLDSKDCLVINKEEDKIVATAGLEGMVIVNMKDVILVIHKDNVPRVKEIVQKLEEQGMEEYI